MFDLTVENHHCYLANGLLVSNSNFSDAFQGLAVGMKKAQSSGGAMADLTFGNMDAGDDEILVAPWEADGEIF